MYRCISFLLCVTSAAFCQVKPLHIGFVHTGDELRQLSGAPASLILGEAMANHPVRASFLDSGGIVVESDAIRILDANGNVLGEFASQDLNAVPGMGASWLPRTKALVWWDGAKFQAVVADGVNGTVLDLTSDGKIGKLLVDDGAVSEVVVDLTSGNVLSSTPTQATGPAIYFGGAVLSSTQASLPCSVTAMERVADSWLHAWCSDGREWAVNSKHGQLSHSELPHPNARPRLHVTGPHAEERK